MIRVLALLLATSAITTAQPQLNRLVIASGGESADIPQFDLTGASAILEIGVAASVSGGTVEGISILAAANDHFGGRSQLVIPTITAPEATVRYPLPRFLEAGTYLLNVGVVDTEGHWRRWTSDELADAGLPNRFEVVVRLDVDGPGMTDIRIDSILDASRPQGVALFTVTDGSGVLAYRVVAESPSGKRRVLADYRSNIGVGPTHTFVVPFDLSSGPELSDPAEEGYWRIVEIEMVDSNGTSRLLSRRDLTNLGIQNRFAVGAVPPDTPLGPGCGAPNPVALGATVRVPSGANVYDVRGRRVAQAGDDGALSTDGLSRGLYLTRSSTPGEAPCRFTVVGR